MRDIRSARDLAARPALFLFLVLAYFVAGKVGLSFAALHASASAVWPPTGIALAAFLLLGPGAWPAIFIGAFLVNVDTSGAALASIGIACGNTLEGLVGAYLVGRYARGADCFHRGGDVFRFSVCAVAATAVGATLGTLCLALFGLAPWGQYAPIWLTWWLGDAAGALIVAPPIILWCLQPAMDMDRTRLMEAVLTFLVVLLVGLVCFGLPGLSRYPVAFLCLPPLAWLALRFSPREVASAVLALAAIAVAATENGLGPFAMPTRHESLLVLQSFMATIALMMMPIAALVQEVARAMIERERAVSEERRARAEAEAATRAKDEFLAMLSHELRNPLQAIGNAMHLAALRGEAGTSDGRAYAIIKRQTEALTRMVNDLLDLARATAGKIVVIRQSVDLEATVRHCLELLERSGRLANHSVEVRTEPIHVHADPTRLEQMLMNLLLNAIKFTPKAGSIRVFTLLDGANGVVRVEDSGIGIPAELLPRIFDLFTQGKQRNPDRREGGLGIGLAMVRRLAELHGGRIEASSDGAGRGSRFVLSLPLARQALAPVERNGERPAHARRVLVIEPGSQARSPLRELLEADGHDVFHAVDSRSGMEAALRVRPEVVIIDLAQGRDDGCEVARALRARSAEIGGRPQVVGVTGYGPIQDEQRARDAGFDEVFAKPVDAAALRRVLVTG